MDRAELRLYEQAKYDGFVTSREGCVAHIRLYRQWCMEKNIPQIDVRLGEKFATIIYDADPTGCPYSCNVPEELWDRFRALFMSHWVPDDSEITGGEHHLGAYGVPNSIAPTIARQLWEWVKPFCISPEARDKSLLEAWTTSN